MTLVADLYALQEIDSAIDQRVSALEALRERYGINPEADGLRAEIAEHAAGLSALEAQQRDFDLQVASLREKAAPVEENLYSGAITNGKELTNLQEELEQIARQRQAIEEQLLIVMEQLEAKRAGVRAGDSRLLETDAAWATDQGGMQAEDGRLEADLAALYERRESLSARIPHVPLALYERVRKRRRGIAVAKVERATCNGCRLSVPAVVLQRARSSTNPTPVQCPSCERILYVI